MTTHTRNAMQWRCNKEWETRCTYMYILITSAVCISAYPTSCRGLVAAPHRLNLPCSSDALLRYLDCSACRFVWTTVESSECFRSSVPLLATTDTPACTAVQQKEERAMGREIAHAVAASNEKVAWNSTLLRRGTTQATRTAQARRSYASDEPKRSCSESKRLNF